MPGLVDIYGGVKNQFELGPGLGAVYGGQGASIGRQQAENETMKQLSDLYTASQNQQQASIMNPLEAKKAQASLAQSEAQLPGFTAESLKKQSEAKIAKATEDADIAEKIAKSGNAQQVAQLSNMMLKGQNISSMFNSGADANQVRSTISDPNEQRVFDDMYKSIPAGVSPTSFFNEESKRLESIISKVNQLRPDYQQAMATGAQKVAGDIKTTGMNNATSLAVANIRATAQKKEQKTLQDAVIEAAKKGPQAAIEMLAVAYNSSVQAGNSDAAIYFKTQLDDATVRYGEQIAAKGAASVDAKLSAVQTMMGKKPAIDGSIPKTTIPSTGTRYFDATTNTWKVK